MAQEVDAGPGAARVSTIELFFDLVFVFTITQLTHLFEHAHDWIGFVQPALVLTVIWWHYAGYVWLTNAAGAERRMRGVLLAAMAGFLVMAIMLPTIFGSGGLAFGLAYLFIVVVHLGAFLWGAGRAGWRAIAPLAGINLGAAGCVLAAGIVDASWDWLFFAAAVAFFGLSTLSRVEGGFSVRAVHFAERHGLVVIIALGESIIAIGVGAADARIDAWTLGAIVLALGAIAALWWNYFDRDDTSGEHALAHAPPARQARLALVGYWYTHLLMIAGVVLAASGIKGIVAHPRNIDPHAVWLLASGLALYLLGSAAFRRALHIGPTRWRAAGAVAMIAVGLGGMVLPSIAAIAGAAGLAVVLLAVEARSTAHLTVT